MKQLQKQTERDRFEKSLISNFGEKIHSIEKSQNIIAKFKDGSFAMSELGLMLYTNGYNLRGISNTYPNGLIYYDGKNIFGVGYFAKEQENVGHLHIVAPKGPNITEAVSTFITQVHKSGLSKSSTYVRYLTDEEHNNFLNAGFLPIDSDPWHPQAPEEDESFPNRVFFLDDLFKRNTDGTIYIKNLKGDDQRGFKKKNRLGYQRFLNFLVREHLSVEINAYQYSPEEMIRAKGIVTRYFITRQKQGGLVGSTPEDYFALIQHKPHGINENDYFSYLGKLKTEDGKSIPIAFFVGEKINNDKVALYATITMRFPEYLGTILHDEKGFTAIPQYIWLCIFMKLWKKGITLVDVGGSETEGLDRQKRQLGGFPKKSFWVVKNDMNILMIKRENLNLFRHEKRTKLGDLRLCAGERTRFEP